MFDPAVGRFESAPSMVKVRYDFNLLVVEDELYAVGGTYPLLSIEKMDRLTGRWEVVSELKWVNRNGCGATCLGSKIFVLGGYGTGTENRTSWDSFDVSTRQWASATTPVSARTLPREFIYGQVLSMTTIKMMLSSFSSSSSSMTANINSSSSSNSVNWTNVMEAAEQRQRLQHTSLQTIAEVAFDLQSQTAVAAAAK